MNLRHLLMDGSLKRSDIMSMCAWRHYLKLCRLGVLLAEDCYNSDSVCALPLASNSLAGICKILMLFVETIDLRTCLFTTTSLVASPV